MSNKHPIDTVSDSFCIAKWKQTTLYLQNGTTHSCHHPSVHKIRPEWIEQDSSMLINTPVKQWARQQMLSGKRPAECGYCWNLEDQNQLSDRYHKSAEPWAAPHLEECKSNVNTTPSYLELSFSSLCNLKCAYCSPRQSSSWQREIERHGAYPTSDSFNSIEQFEKMEHMPIAHDAANPYVDAFWDWFPKNYQDIEVLRLTGGEPLLHSDVWKMMQFIADTPRSRPLRAFSVNTNLSIPEKKIDALCEQLDVMSRHAQEINVFVSLESIGDKAEYVRYGLDYELFNYNLLKLLDNFSGKVHFMSTVNVLSITNTNQFVDYIEELKHRFGKLRVQMALPILRHPQFLCYHMLPTDIWQKAVSNINTERSMLTVREHRELSRLKEIKQQTHYQQFQEDFKKYVREYDRRRGTDFGNTFPDLCWW